MKNQLNEEFLSLASHELKTPVTALKLQVQLAQKLLNLEKSENITPEKLQVFLNRSSQDLDKLTHLIDEIFALSSLEEDSLVIEPNYILLDELMWNFVSKKKFRISADVNGPVLVRWDSAKIEQALTYLMSNSTLRGAKQISLSVETGGSYVHITISDDGEIVPKEQQRSIFKKNPSKRFKEGSGSLGQGLYIAKELLQLHKGDVWFRSEVGKGSVFTIMIPTHPA